MAGTMLHNSLPFRKFYLKKDYFSLCVIYKIWVEYNIKIEFKKLRMVNKLNCSQHGGELSKLMENAKEIPINLTTWKWKFYVSNKSIKNFKGGSIV